MHLLSNFAFYYTSIMPPSDDGICVICDSYVRPHVLVRICDECNYGSYEGRCVVCGAPGISDAYYCRECTLQEKDVRLDIVLQCRYLSTHIYISYVLM